MLRSISRVNTPPSVSMPSDSGVTSSSSTSLTSPFSTPPWIAAPTATTSSGLTPRCGSRPKKLLHRLDDLRHAGHAADQDHLVDLGRLQAGVLERGAARLDRLLDQIVDQRFELGARQLDVEVLRAGLVRRDERQVDLGLHRRRQLDLRLLGGLLQALQRELVLAQVDALLLFELVGEVVDDAASKSSPPRNVSPLVDFTSNTPSPISSTEMSNVPPPRS